MHTEVSRRAHESQLAIQAEEAELFHSKLAQVSSTLDIIQIK
jgi:hypothetical protein